MAVEIMSRIQALIESGHGAQVRTRYGSWRSVVAVYSDQTVGTTRVGAVRGFTIIEASAITKVRTARINEWLA